MNGNETGKRKNDLLLIGALFLAALLSVCVFRGSRAFAGTSYSVVIRQDGETVVEEKITGEKEYQIACPDGGVNVIRVRSAEEGYGIECVEADCPEHTCMEQGFITLPEEPVVCLPHRLTAVIRNDR